MAEDPRAHVTPKVLAWAREAAGLDLESAATRAHIAPDRLREAEQGEHLLTFRQARVLAQTYGRSLAFLMRSAPPDEPSVETKFRRLRGAPPPPWSAELVRLERDLRMRQDAALEIYDALGEEPPWHDAQERFGLPERFPGPDVVRVVLGLDPEERQGDVWSSRRQLLQAIEWTGALVVRQPLPDADLRGFLVPHDDVPMIYVNSREDPRAQAFTMAHEFVHLLLAAAGRIERDEEEWCERFAGQVLMPTEEFLNVLQSSSGNAVNRAKTAAAWFGVTPFAAAVRARQLGAFTVTEMLEVRDRPTSPAPDAKGGDGNRNKVARLSPTFTDLVLAAADSSALTLSTASRLLRTKVDDFDKLRRWSTKALSE